jgi:cysteinyl-tRNA synthetase
MANVWMHNGFLQVEGEKMSKSLGNFVTIRDVLKDWPGEVARFNMLRTHYRQPIDWTVKGLEESWKTLDDWYWVVNDAPSGSVPGSVLDALGDDLNTPQCIAALHGIRNLAQNGSARAREELAASLRLLGFLGETAAQWVARRQLSSDIDASKVQSLIDARTAARKSKNFAESDRIRDELAAMGVVLKDSKEGTTWEIAR